ncbi:MAG: hypothetical protein IKX53_04860 [Bacteroidales bacterium]|nr:hypothetical protein [Bacteroidales bacterium]
MKRKRVSILLLLGLMLSVSAGAQVHFLPINDTTVYIYSAGRQFDYVGSGQEPSKTHSALAEGFGMARYEVHDEVTGDTQYEYCLCPWKRGFRHGEGLWMRADGSVVKAQWRWDKLRSVLEEPPSEAERAEFDRRLIRLQAVIRLMGR